MVGSNRAVPCWKLLLWAWPMEVDVIIITMSVESLCCRMSLLVLGSYNVEVNSV